MLSELLGQMGKTKVTETEAAKTIFNGLKAAGINLVATLPDINLAQLLQQVEADRGVIHVPLCREEEGIGICAGAYLVGKNVPLLCKTGDSSTATTRL